MVGVLNNRSSRPGGFWKILLYNHQHPDHIRGTAMQICTANYFMVQSAPTRGGCLMPRTLYNQVHRVLYINNFINASVLALYQTRT